MEMCPCCGYNFTADAPITVGRWTLTGTEVERKGKPLAITAVEANFLHTLAKAKGKPVRADVVGRRISTAEDPENFARVYAHRLRAKFRKMRLKPPFLTVPLGYRWAGR